MLWGGLRIAYVHLQMRKSSKFYLHHDVVINNSIAWGIPALFATVALSLDELGYVTSHYCGPTLSKGEALLWVPLLVYISMASVLQTWTLYEIARVPYLSHQHLSCRRFKKRTIGIMVMNVMNQRTHRFQARLIISLQLPFISALEVRLQIGQWTA